MYKLIISPEAQKQLKTIKLQYKKDAVSEALEEIKDDPHVGKPLEDELSGRYAYKLGEYRIIYKFNEKDKTILVISAGHRGVIYN